MALTELKVGTKSLSGNTEWSLTADAAFSATANTTTGCYQAFVDLSDMTSGDLLNLKIYEKCRSSNSQLTIYSSYLAGSQAEPLWVSPSLILMNGWDITANSQQGGSILINWSLRQIA